MYLSSCEPDAPQSGVGWGDGGRSAAWCAVERTNFDRVAGEAEDRLGAHEEPCSQQADACSYFHLLVSGIIVSAVGLKAAVATSPSRRPLVCLPAGRRRSAAVNARSCAALEPSRQTWILEAMKRLRTRHAPADDLASVGSSVLRSGLATNLLWIGTLKFKQYEVENIDPLLRSSPLFSRLREKLGARRLARVIGIAEIALGSLIAAKPVAPKASAAASLGAVGMFLTTLSFLVTTPEARQEGEGMLVPSPAGQFLLKDTVLLAAALLTAAESLRAARR
jgi:reactive chlorine resistance protein C